MLIHVCIYLAQLLTRMDKMHAGLVRAALDALSSLADRGDRRAVRVALEQMDTTHNYVRGVAVEALETLSGAPGIRAAVASVLAGMEENYSFVRQAAKEVRGGSTG